MGNWYQHCSLRIRSKSGMVHLQYKVANSRTTVSREADMMDMAIDDGPYNISTTDKV